MVSLKDLFLFNINNYLLCTKYFQDESDSDEPEIIAEYEHEQIIEDVKTAPETAQAQDSSSSSSDSESENVEKEIVSEENLMETIESFQKSNLKTVETVVKASLPDQDDVAQEKEIIEAETEQNKEFFGKDTGVSNLNL